VESSGKQPPAKPEALQALQGLSNFRFAEITYAVV